ncbi:MAG TPA: bis(5'-nucleosyl)-tetraphosphatase (symmetrical) YqeK [Candidatus Mediterraneibacter norfolkensis]|nr:bis(5'-nucleosyl)-tetraphosphatase (symmetrical) YqeK [Candidatus Mediterraneibacter norfolkensis]
MTEELLEIKKDLSKKLKKDRFEHTVGVMYTAASLAMRYGEDIQKALTAGLLHDCGKFCSAKEQMKLCSKKGIELSESELEMPALIHAKLGAYLAEHEYGIKDSSILDAITYHTTGRPDMTMLEKIVYIADYIEPNRAEIPGLPDVRRLAFEEIDQAVCRSAESTTRYLREGGKSVDPMTIRTYNFYKKGEVR